MEKWQTVLGDLTRKPEHVLRITARQQRIYFKPAAQLAKQGVRAKSLLRDEAEDLAGELQESYEAPLEPAPAQGWFVRTSACSPKDALDDGGAGPHHSLVDVVLALLASARVHTSMKDYNGAEDVRVYLIPFDRTVTVERELRVFVHDHQVTAMSQYDVYNTSSVFAPMDDAQLAQVARGVDDFHRQQVRPRWTGIASYIMDVEYLVEGDDESSNCAVRLIELNSFGAEMAAASALFHWVRDAEELYSSRADLYPSSSRRRRKNDLGQLSFAQTSTAVLCRESRGVKCVCPAGEGLHASYAYTGRDQTCTTD